MPANSSSPGRVPRRAGTITFSAVEVARALARVDTGGQVAVLEPLLPAGGRDREVTLRGLLLALTLLADSGQPMYLSLIPDILNNLTPSQRHEVGISKNVTYRKVRTLFSHFADLMDGSPHFGGRQSSAAQRAEADERLQVFVDATVDASLPDDGVYTTDGHLAFDATTVDANARPEATKVRRRLANARKRASDAGLPTDLVSLLAADVELARKLRVPDAEQDPVGYDAALVRLRRMDKTSPDPDAATIHYKGKRLRHAYDIHLAVDVPSETDVDLKQRWVDAKFQADKAGVPVAVEQPLPTPLLVRAMTVTPATAHAGKTGTKLLKRLAKRRGRNGFVPGDVVADRGYSHALPEHWHHPLRASGFRLVHDLHPQRRGRTGTFKGVVIIDGEPFSPGILEFPDLVNLPPVPPNSTFAERKAVFDRVKLREPFRLPVHSRSGDGTAVRLTCPALRGKLGCEARGTVDLVLSKGVPEVFNPPGVPLPAICSAKAVTVPADVLAHSNDGLAYGSQEWHSSYFRRRARVEAANGIAKNPTAGHLGDLRVRVRGRAKSTVMFTFIIASMNVAATAAWLGKCAVVVASNALAATARASRKPLRRRAVANTGRRPRAPSA